MDTAMVSGTWREVLPPAPARLSGLQILLIKWRWWYPLVRFLGRSNGCESALLTMRCYVVFTAFLPFWIPPVRPSLFCSLPPTSTFKAGGDQIRCTETENKWQQCVSLPNGMISKFCLCGKKRQSPSVTGFRQNKQVNELFGSYWVPCLWVLLEPWLTLGENCCRVPGSWIRK